MADHLVLDYRRAELPPATRAICDFAVKLTLSPGRMERTDVDCLREHGWSDEQILIATQVIGYFNYINRVADALGVAPENWMTMSVEKWREDKGQFR